MLHLHAACPVCISILNANAVYPCSVSMLRVHVPMLHVDAEGICYMIINMNIKINTKMKGWTLKDILRHVRASCPCSMPSFYAAILLYICSWCLSIMHFNFGCPFCMPMPHVHASCQCSLYKYHAACPFCLSMLHVQAVCLGKSYLPALLYSGKSWLTAA